MILKRYALICCAALVLLAAAPISALACACCAEPGTYFLRTARTAGYELDVVRDLEFTKPADLYMTEAGFEMVKGLDPIRKEYESDTWTAESSFDLAAAFSGKRWTFDLRTPMGTVGSLSLPLPSSMLIYKVDIHDEEDRPNGPLLYKEFRFKGNLGAAGGFARAGNARGTTYFLVFQGRGNGCDNAADFTHWRLEISGPRASYAFFGKLNTESARKKDVERSRWSGGMP